MVNYLEKKAEYPYKLQESPEAISLEKLKKAAFETGYHQGLQQALAEHSSKLQNIINNFEIEIVAKYCKNWEEFKASLPSLFIAIITEGVQSILQQELTVNSNYINEALKDIINNYTSPGEKLIVTLHPEDAVNVISQDSLTLVTDPNIERGGFKVEGNNFDIDMLLKRRIKEFIDQIQILPTSN